ncbi:MAG: rRNA pseudouridine synthase [Oscillospiraceae bacterium]|nr:rRNA pseudouridine synthase [Oscillospiraceae bacterium]
MIRLDKFAADQTGISRSEAAKLIASGKLLVNGSKMPASARIDEENDTVTLDGQRIVYRKYVYIMLNKPAGVICATKDRLTQTVIDLIPPELRRKGLFPAGRLDKDTRGFVLITDDGALAHDILSPRRHVEKEYEVTLESPAKAEYEHILADGIVIDGLSGEESEKCLPARIVYTDDPCMVRLVICEGTFHQIKRMAEALGNRVTGLRRIRIGNIVLDAGLGEGECREISHKEISTIR